MRENCTSGSVRGTSGNRRSYRSEQKEVTMRAQPFTALVEYAGANVRVDFIRRTYQHLAWAVLGFIAVEALLLQWSGAQVLVRTMTRGYAWFIVLAAFMGV